MEKCIDKLSSYNILNNILPGVAFCYLCNKLWQFNIVHYSLVENLFVFYFIGMIISRIGSLFVEPICKKLKIIIHYPYDCYMSASKKDDTILVLSETNNTYRSIVALCIALIHVKLFLLLEKMLWFSYISNWVIIFCVFIIFVLSYRKQTKYIHNRIEIISKGTTMNKENI